jgi:hypothetical protein
MSSKRKISALLLYLLLICVVMATVQRSRPVGNANFKGWTTDRGALHAVIEFPPVSKSEPAKNYFVRWFYCVQLDFNYNLPSGRATNESLWLPVMESPRQFITVKIPVPHNITNLRFTRTQTSIERRWDNISLPFRRHSTRYTFTPPKINSIPES